MPEPLSTPSGAQAGVAAPAPSVLIPPAAAPSPSLPLFKPTPTPPAYPEGSGVRPPLPAFSATISIPLAGVVVGMFLLTLVTCFFMLRAWERARQAAVRRRAAERTLRRQEAEEAAAGAGLDVSLFLGESLPGKGLEPALIAALPTHTFEGVVEGAVVVLWGERQDTGLAVGPTASPNSVGVGAPCLPRVEEVGKDKEGEGPEDLHARQEADMGLSAQEQLGHGAGQEQLGHGAGQEMEKASKSTLLGTEGVLLECPRVSAAMPHSSTWLGQGGILLECPVCLGEYEKGDVLKTIPQCGHSFHEPCIVSWLWAKTTCPLCRLDLRPKEQGEELQGSPHEYAPGGLSQESSLVAVSVEPESRAPSAAVHRPEERQ